jgi:hypothetical protein
MTHECSRLLFRNSHFEFSWNLNFVIWDFKRYHHKILRGYELPYPFTGLEFTVHG